jgi:hypothetical protein
MKLPYSVDGVRTCFRGMTRRDSEFFIDLLKTDAKGRLGNADGIGL